MTFSSCLALNQEGWWHTLTGTRLGRKPRFLLSEAAIGDKLEKHPTYKRILFSAPHSLPFSSVRGTDVPSSQYRGTTRRRNWSSITSTRQILSARACTTIWRNSSSTTHTGTSSHRGRCRAPGAQIFRFHIHYIQVGVPALGLRLVYSASLIKSSNPIIKIMVLENKLHLDYD